MHVRIMKTGASLHYHGPLVRIPLISTHLRKIAVLRRKRKIGEEISARNPLQNRSPKPLIDGGEGGLRTAICSR